MLIVDDSTTPSPMDIPLENLAHSIVSEQKEKEQVDSSLSKHQALISYNTVITIIINIQLCQRKSRE